jgi:hypothetical protein
MTPLEELQHVLFGQLTHGNPTSDLECMLDALREAMAQGMEEAAEISGTFNKGYNIGEWMAMDKNDVARRMCLDVADAIRARAAAIRNGMA